MINKIRNTIAFFAIFLGVFSSPVANANLLGTTVFTNDGSGLSPRSAIVGNGIEFIGINGYINFDFGANTLTLTLNEDFPIAFRGFGSFVFSGFSETIHSFSLVENQGFTGSVVTNYSFSPHSITLDMSAGEAPGRNLPAVFAINEATVPEPAPLSLLALGLLAFAFTRKKLC